MPVVGTALAAAGTWLTTAATGKIVANLLISASLTALQSALQKYAMRRQPLPGIQTEYTAEGGTNPMSFIAGRYATGGQMVCPPMSHGKHRRNHNAYLTYVIALSDVPGAPLEKVIINDKEVNFAANAVTIPLGGTVLRGMPREWYQMQGLNPDDPEAGITRIPIGRPATGEFAGNVWLTYYNGRQIAADPYLLQVYGEGTPWAEATERPWTPDMVGHGTCYAIVTFRLNPDLWQGPPRCLFELGGIPLYDPRRDSTAGGDGPQRWSDPATWAPSSNAKVIEYNILRGIPIGGGPLWGYGVPASALPLSDWAPAMNAADAAGEDGPVWRAGLEIGVDQEPATILDEILKVSHSQVAESSGVWKTAIGAGGAPVWHFTDRDVLLSAPSSQTPFPGLQNTYNAVHAAYPEPEQLWKSKDAPPRYNSAWEASDQARRLPAELSLPACPYAEQVQRVMRSYVEEERRFRRHVLAIVPEGAMLEPLDIVAWSSEEQGYQNKRFRVTEMAEDLLTGEVTIAITERDPDDYSWRPDFRLPSALPSIDMPAPAPIAPEFFSAEGLAIADDQGHPRRAGVRLRWGGWAIEGVSGVRYEIEHGDQVLRGTMSDPVRGEHVVENLMPAQSGRARISFIGGADEWTEWESFETPAIKLTELDVDFEQISAEVLAELADLEEWIDSEFRVDYEAALDAARDAIDASEAAILARDLADGYADAARMDSEASALAIIASQEAADLAGNRANLAHGAAQGAAGSASAAAGDAALAKARADDAEREASVATAQALKATTQVAQMLPSDFRGDYWTRQATGAPEAVPGLNLDVTVDSAGVLTIPAGLTTNRAVLAKGVVAAQPGRTYRITARVMMVGQIAPNRFVPYLYRLNDEMVYISGAAHSVSRNQITAPNEYQEISGTITTGDWPNTSWYRMGFVMLGSLGPAVEIKTQWIKIEDITAEVAAQGHAEASLTHSNTAAAHSTQAGEHSAAAAESRNLAAQSVTDAGDHAVAAQSSAAAAETKANAAEQAAQVASQQRGLAQTARGQAETYAANAANSKNDAAGAASTATQQAGVATSAKNDAQGAATAAAGSASTAASRATDAALAASAAEAHRLAASTHESNANIARDAAVDAKQGAEGAQAAAQTSAELAVASYNDALILNGNPYFARGNEGWRNGSSGVGDLPGQSWAGARGGSAWRINGLQTFNWPELIPNDPERRYRITMVVRRVGSVSPTRVYLGVYRCDANGNRLPSGQHYPSGWTDVSSTSFQTLTAEFDGAALGPDAVNFVLFGIVNYAPDDASCVVDAYFIEDITSEHASAGHAAASAASATTAGSYASESEAWAVAANTSRLGAETERSAAIIARNEAVVARNEAQGAATSGAQILERVMAQYQTIELVPDPTFSQRLDLWPSGGLGGNWLRQSRNADSPALVLRAAPAPTLLRINTGATGGIWIGRVPVSPGDVLDFGFAHFSDSGSHDLRMRLRTRDAQGAIVTAVAAAVTNATKNARWRSEGQSYAIPAGVATVDIILEIQNSGGHTWITNATSTRRARGLAAAVETLSQAQTDLGGAIADYQVNTNARIDRGTAGGRLRFTSEATPAGILSRAAIRVVANDGAANTTAAGYWQATTDGHSSVLFSADRFAIINGSAVDTSFVPFAVQGGVVYLDKARIRNADIDNAKIRKWDVTRQWGSNFANQEVTGTGNNQLIANLTFTAPYEINVEFAFMVNFTLHDLVQGLSGRVLLNGSQQHQIHFYHPWQPNGAVGHPNMLSYSRFAKLPAGTHTYRIEISGVRAGWNGTFTGSVSVDGGMA